MKYSNKLRCALALLMFAGLSTFPVSARQQGEEKPKPAAKEYPPLLDTQNNPQNDDQAQQQTIQPDSQPLTSVQVPTLGTPEMRHSYWIPGIKYSNAILSKSYSPTTNSSWNTTSFVSGDMSLLEAWSHSLLSTNYSGGGFFSTDPVQGNGQYHQFASAYEVDLRSWQLLFVDQFSYLPQTAFGFGGPTALGFPGITGVLAVPLPGLQPEYLPGQTVLSAIGPRYSNAGAAQISYAFSRRSSLTISGLYSDLHFINAGNVDSDVETLNAGYSYEISKNDSIGLQYRFSAYHFPGSPQAVGDHSAEFVYGRKITGRMALKLAGGPQIIYFRIPVSGISQKITGSGSALLTYGFARGGLTLGYTHDLGGGSGVLTGAVFDLANATLARQLTRAWLGNLNFGYARNRPVISVTGATPQVFDAWIAGAGVTHAVGRTGTFSLAYQSQIQSSNFPICGAPTCGTNYDVNQVILTFEWHTRPVVLR
jgi:hypothetical protein